MEKPRIENLSAFIPIDMYQVSGHGEIDPEKYLRNKRQDDLIRLAADRGDILNKIQFAPEQERVSLIKQALSQEDPEVQRKAAEMIWFAPEQERVSLIKQALSQEDPEVHRKAAEMIWFAPEQERVSLIKIAFDAGLGNEIIKPPLYDRSNLDKERFQRKEFEKTGSETKLVGGALKDKLIIRRIQPKAFLAWQKIYENYQAWKDNGFDYVPIEPIQSYKLNKEGKVDVFSGVLDLSLTEWSEISV